MKSMYNNQMQGRQVSGNMMQGRPMQVGSGMGGQVPLNNMYTGYQFQHSQYAQTAYTNQAVGLQSASHMQNNQYQNQHRQAPMPNPNMPPVRPVQINSIKFNNASNIQDNNERTVLIHEDINKRVQPQANVAPVKQEMPQIVIYGTSGEYAEAAFSLEQPITFGRSKESCNLIFAPNASGVSRVHCKISARPDGNVLLQDLGSSYGVKVNGNTQVQPGESVVLAVGCRFTIGSNETFEICSIN